MLLRKEKSIQELMMRINLSTEESAEIVSIATKLIDV